MIRKIIGVFRRKHPDIYTLAKKYADEKGVSVGDVIATAVASFVASQDEEYKEELINIIKGRSVAASSSGANISQIKDLVEVFRELTLAVADIMKASQEVSHSVLRSSIVTELKETMRTVEEIKSIGETRGGTDKMISDAFLNLLFSRLGAGMLGMAKSNQGGNKKKHKVEEFEG